MQETALHLKDIVTNAAQGPAQVLSDSLSLIMKWKQITEFFLIKPLKIKSGGGKFFILCPMLEGKSNALKEEMNEM